MNPEAAKEVADFRDRLMRKATAIEAARESLIQRVREFVDAHGRNGSKTGRPDYVALISLDKIEPLRIALDEFDRVWSGATPTETNDE